MSNILQANRLLQYYEFFASQPRIFNPYHSAIKEHEKELLPEKLAIYKQLTEAVEAAKQQFKQYRNELNATNFVQAIEALTKFMEDLNFPYVSIEQYMQLTPILLHVIARTTIEGYIEKIEQIEEDARQSRKRPHSP